MYGGKRQGAGRPAGSENKLTKELRQHFETLLNNNVDKLQSLLDKVAEDNPTKAIELILKVSEFVLPKLKSVELPEPPQEPQKIIIKVVDSKVGYAPQKL